MPVAPGSVPAPATARAWIELTIDERLKRPWPPTERVRLVHLPEAVVASAAVVKAAYEAVGWTVGLRTDGAAATLIFGRPTT